MGISRTFRLAFSPRRILIADLLTLKMSERYRTNSSFALPSRGSAVSLTVMPACVRAIDLFLAFGMTLISTFMVRP